MVVVPDMTSGVQAGAIAVAALNTVPRQLEELPRNIGSVREVGTADERGKDS